MGPTGGSTGSWFSHASWTMLPTVVMVKSVCPALSLGLLAPSQACQPPCGDLVGDRQWRGGVAVGIDEVRPRLELAVVRVRATFIGPTGAGGWVTGGTVSTF